MVSVGCFGVRVSVVFRFVFVRYAFGSVWVAGWPPFGRWLPARLAFCSRCVMSVCSVCSFPALGFGSRVFRFLFIAFLLLQVVAEISLTEKS